MYVGIFSKMEDLKFQNPTFLSFKIAILGSRFFFTISNLFLIQNISVASGYSGEFFECTFCRKTFF